MVLQLSLDHRQRRIRRGSFDGGEEVAHCAEAQFRQGCIFAHLNNLLDHFFCDRAAMIANAEKEAGVIESWSKGPGRRRSNKIGSRGVVPPYSQGQDSRSVGTLPPEQQRKVHLMFLRPHK